MIKNEIQMHPFIESILKDLDFQGLSQETENWYSVSGPGDISLYAYSDGYEVQAVGFDDEPGSVHSTLPQALKEIERLSDRAYDEDL